MDSSQTYVLIVVMALAVVGVLLILSNKMQKNRRISPLASVAFSLIVAGIVFGENRILGYSLMGLGVGFSLLDMFMNKKKRS